MSDELLMDLADCGSPEKLLTVILKHHPAWTAPVPVEELAMTVNIVEFRELEGDSFEGALLTDANKQKGVILYKAGARIERRRFTIAHELCHFLMPSHKGNQQCTAGPQGKPAGYGSSAARGGSEPLRGRIVDAEALVFPRSRSAGQCRCRACHDPIEAVLHESEATSNRYCELTDDTCAFVFAKDNVIRYARRSATFPRLSLSTGDRLPIGSSSLRASSLPLRVASAWSEVDGSVWLETERGRQAPTILEQTIRQSDGFQTTLLFIAPEEIEADEDAEIESWEVGFRRR